jgi:hypothetical protein
MRFSNAIWSILFVCTGIISYAQQDTELGRAVYVELVGKGFFSANVDLPISNNGRLTLGLTMLDHEFSKEEFEEEYPVQTLPTPSVMYFHLFGKEKHYFEAGFGLSVSPVPWKEYSENDSVLSLHGCLGYRYQKPNAFFFRAGLTPFYRVNWAFLPLVGVSFGYGW